MLFKTPHETTATMAERICNLMFFVLIIGYALKPEKFSVGLIILLIILGVILYGFAVCLRRDRR